MNRLAATACRLLDKLRACAPLIACLLLASCDSDHAGFPADHCLENCVTGDETLFVSPPLSLLLVGSERQLTATLVAPDGTQEDVTGVVTWKSSNSAMATVSPGGLVTGVASGTTRVTAALPQLEEDSAIAVSGLAIDRILVAPAHRQLLPGLTQQYTTTAVLSDGSTIDVTSRTTWSVGNPAVASIDATGRATALAEGVTSVNASYTTPGQAVLTAAATLAVRPPIVRIEEFFLAPLSATTVPGGQVTYRAFVITSENETLEVSGAVTWGSTQTAVAEIDAAGVATAHATGDTAILASLTYLGRTLFAPAGLTVVAPSLTELSITPQWAEVIVGQQQAFTATAVMAGGFTIDVTDRVLWESLAPGIAAIDPNGLATTLAVGEANISASLTFLGTNYSALALLVVDAPPPVLQSLSVVPSDEAVLVDDHLQYRCIATFSDGSLHEVTGLCVWSVADPAVAVIDGLGGLLTGIAAGSTTVEASWTYAGVPSVGSTSVQVIAPLSVAALQVTPESAESLPLGTQQFRAHALLSDGRKIDVTSNVAWTSLDPTVAVVDSVGHARGLTPGQTAIRATVTVQGTELADAADFTVLPPAVSIEEMRVLPPRQTVVAGARAEFEAEILLSNGALVDATEYATWFSLSPSIAQGTSENGRFVGIQPGTTSVVARIDHEGTTYSASAELIVVPDAKVSGLEIEPVSPLLVRGEQRQLDAFLLFSTGDALVVTDRVAWSSANASIASVNAEGLATGIAAGMTDITAAAIAGPVTESDSVTAHVVDPALVLVALRVSPPAASVLIGGEMKFTATAYYLSGDRVDVSGPASWTIADPNVAELLSQEGLVRGTAAGSTTVTAHYNANGTQVLASAVLVVQPPPVTITGIQVTPASQAVASGNSARFEATALLSDLSHVDVTGYVQWQSSDTAIARATGIAGEFETFQQGAVTISATLVHEGQSHAGQAALVVQAAQPVFLQVTPPQLGLTIGEQGQLYAIVHFTDETTEDVTGEVAWHSRDSSIAAVGAGAHRGVVTGIGVGLTAIDAVYRESLSATAPVRVRAPALLSIDVLPSAIAIAAGETQKFTAIGNYDDDSALDLTDTVLWTSSDEGIAAIVGGDPQGQALGVAPGVATISASLDGTSGSALLTVTAAVAVALEVGPDAAGVPIDGYRAFIAVATFSDGSRHEVTDEVTWTSSAPLIASVSNQNDSEGVAQGRNPGMAQIRATLDGTLQDFGTLLVLNPIGVSLVVSPATETVSAGSNVYYEATLILNDASELDVTAEARWTSSNPDVASISNGPREGTASALEPGATSIRAALGPLATTVSLTVTPTCDNDFEDEPRDFDLLEVVIATDVTIRIGETAQLQIIGVYDDENDVDSDPDCFQDLTEDSATAWDSDDENVVMINRKSGIVTGIGPGTAAVDVRYRGNEDSAMVTVLP